MWIEGDFLHVLIICLVGIIMEPKWNQIKEKLMPTITVKNIPDELYERLKEVASANRRSINSEIIISIEHHVGANRIVPTFVV